MENPLKLNKLPSQPLKLVDVGPSLQGAEDPQEALEVEEAAVEPEGLLQEAVT